MVHDPGESEAGGAVPARVLLVEDNPGDALLVREALDADPHRWEIDHVSRLAAAAAALRSGEPDVVLLDLSLPDATGLEGVTQLARVAPDVPLVVLTGASDASSGARAVAQGAQDYLLKGELDGRVLGRVLWYAIERHGHAQRAQLLAREQAARAVAEEARRRALLLADASTAVSSSLDERQALAALAHALVPRLAAYCAVERLDAHGVAKALVAAGPEAALREFEIRAGDSAAEAALRASCDRGPRIEEPRSLLAADGADPARDLGLRAAAVVPLRVRGEALGTLTLATAGAYQAEDLLLAEEIARRAAAAVESARLYARALDAVQTRDDFLSIAGHELRTPLSSILLDCERLDRLKGSCPEPFRAGIERLHRCGYRLASLVDELLDVSRIRAGRFVLDVSDVDLGELVRDVADGLAATIARAGSDLDLGSIESVRGRWDRSRLQQVVSNLLQNAARYGAGKPVQVLVEAGGGVARLRVRDHGHGIDPRDQASIFERFSRAPAAKPEGLGLGLWIARGIIEAHGGSIAVESRPGAGAEFRVELPCAGPPEGTAGEVKT